MSKSIVKVGGVFTTNNYGDCIVVDYINSYKVKVKFISTGYARWCESGDLRKGEVKDPYYPSIYGIGYIGEGEHLASVNRKNTKEYKLWNSMLRRCYYIKHRLYHRYGGRGVTVCKEWHNFQNFADWVVEQPNYNKEGFHLDKDLRIFDSKEYSPDTCSFVIQKVNNLLTSHSSKRGEYPVGVSWRKRDKKFISQCKDGAGNKVYLGCYQTQEEAFQAYKEYKENLIKQVATEEFDKGNIIKEVYDNLMEWEVVPFPE